MTLGAARAPRTVQSLLAELEMLGASPHDARELVAAVLDVSRSWPARHAGHQPDTGDADAIREAGARLARGMPLAYAARRATFRGLTLHVDERVLIPRPETEMLVDLVLDASGGRGVAIDVGTGSGAIAISLALEGAFTRVIGTDTSPGALAVARLNAGQCGSAHSPWGAGAVEFREGSYLAPCAGLRADLVVSNPPYIAPSERADLPAAVVEWEPAEALFAADGGMAAIAAIAGEAVGVLVPGGVLALEVDSRRAGTAAACVAQTNAYTGVAVRPDNTGRARFVIARRAEA